VDQFGIYLMHDDMDGTLEAYGDKVIPALRGRLSFEGGVAR
jgi:hypothetical protein